MMDLLRRRKGLTEPEIRYYLVQLIGACLYMHGENVIHRDLKLGNIFLDARMDVKVGDFGLAALIEKEGERKKCVVPWPARSSASSPRAGVADPPSCALTSLAHQDHLRHAQLHRARGPVRHGQRPQL